MCKRVKGSATFMAMVVIWFFLRWRAGDGKRKEVVDLCTDEDVVFASIIGGVRKKAWVTI